MLVRSSAAVTARYLRSTFALDFVAAFPWAWLGGIDTTTADNLEIRLLRLLRLLRPTLHLMRGSAIQGRTADFWAFRFNPGVVRVLQLLLLLLCTCHWIGWVLPKRGTRVCPFRHSPRAPMHTACTPIGITALAGGTHPRRARMPHVLRCIWWFICVYERRQGIISTWHPPDDILGAAASLNPLNATFDFASGTVLRRTPVQTSFGLQYAHAFLWGAALMTGFIPYDIKPVRSPLTRAIHSVILRPFRAPHQRNLAVAMLPPLCAVAHATAYCRRCVPLPMPPPLAQHARVHVPRASAHRSRGLHTWPSHR